MRTITIAYEKLMKLENRKQQVRQIVGDDQPSITIAQKILTKIDKKIKKLKSFLEID